jgi:hypothetical protein
MHLPLALIDAAGHDEFPLSGCAGPAERRMKTNMASIGQRGFSLDVSSGEMLDRSILRPLHRSIAAEGSQYTDTPEFSRLSEGNDQYRNAANASLRELW